MAIDCIKKGFYGESCRVQIVVQIVGNINLDPKIGLSLSL